MSQHNLKTLVEVLNDLKEQGYTEDFNFNNGSLAVLGGTGKYSPEEITVNEEFRFEGESNPADSSILYALTTSDGKKGTMVDSYGAASHNDLEAFIKKADSEVS